MGTQIPMHNITEEDRRNKAWKFEGYPRFSEFMASDKDFFVLRRFSCLSARVMLKLQHEIFVKEQEIRKLDEQIRKNPSDHMRCDSFQCDELSPPNSDMKRRAVLLNDSKGLLKEYNDFLGSFTTSRRQQRAYSYQVQNVRNWFATHKNAILDKEQSYLESGDLMAPLTTPRNPLRQFLENTRLARMLFRKDARPDQEQYGTIYYHGTGLELSAKFLIIIFGLGMLYGPMWWLNWVQDNTKRLGVITGFVTVFALLLAVTSLAREFEILAATAAYAAVLMVFLQAQSSGSHVGSK